VHLGDCLTHLALEPLHRALHAPDLLLESDHVVDASEVEAQLLGQAVDEPQPLEVRL
jgi:hypothetical protein